jgi:hypothetical protein
LGALAKRADHFRGRIGASLRGEARLPLHRADPLRLKPSKQARKDNADRELEGERKERERETEGPVRE